MARLSCIRAVRAGSGAFARGFAGMTRTPCAAFPPRTRRRGCHSPLGGGGGPRRTPGSPRCPTPWTSCICRPGSCNRPRGGAIASGDGLSDAEIIRLVPGSGNRDAGRLDSEVPSGGCRAWGAIVPPAQRHSARAPAPGRRCGAGARTRRGRRWPRRGRVPLPKIKTDRGTPNRTRSPKLLVRTPLKGHYRGFAASSWPQLNPAFIVISKGCVSSGRERAASGPGCASSALTAADVVPT